MSGDSDRFLIVTTYEKKNGFLLIEVSEIGFNPLVCVIVEIPQILS